MIDFLQIIVPKTFIYLSKFDLLITEPYLIKLLFNQLIIVRRKLLDICCFKTDSYVIVNSRKWKKIPTLMVEKPNLRFKKPN